MRMANKFVDVRGRIYPIKQIEALQSGTNSEDILPAFGDTSKFYLILSVTVTGANARLLYIQGLGAEDPELYLAHAADGVGHIASENGVYAVAPGAALIAESAAANDSHVFIRYCECDSDPQ